MNPIVLPPAVKVRSIYSDQDSPLIEHLECQSGRCGISIIARPTKSGDVLLTAITDVPIACRQRPLDNACNELIEHGVTICLGCIGHWVTRSHLFMLSEPSIQMNA